jgi:hypothetical protein
MSAQMPSNTVEGEVNSFMQMVLDNVCIKCNVPSFVTYLASFLGISQLNLVGLLAR